MSRFAGVPRVGFGRRPTGPADTLAAKLSRNARRTAQLAEARAVLNHLPSPGEALHAIITGRYDLMHLLLAVLERQPPLTLRIATLSYNARNLKEMTAILEDKAPPALTLLCSAFFRDHNKGLWEETLALFRQHGQRAAAARTHAKVITLETLAGGKLVIEGSANLRSNSNREQVAVINDAGLHQWHSQWIDALVAEHEGESGGEGG
jgi:hypothetical protein